MFLLSLLAIVVSLAAFIYTTLEHRRLARFMAPTPTNANYASQAELDEMRAHIIECINAVNLLAAETGHGSAAQIRTAPTGEYRSSQSYQR